MTIFLLQGCVMLYKKKTKTPVHARNIKMDWADYMQTETQKRIIWVFYDGKNAYSTRRLAIRQDSMIVELSPIDKNTHALLFNSTGLTLKKYIEPPQRNTLYFITEEELSADTESLRTENVSHLKHYQNAFGLNFVINGALAFGGTVIVGVAIIYIICNCPRVYTLDHHGNKILHGTLLTGAISKSLEREDMLILDNIAPGNGQVNLSILNELPEREYIDKLEILKAYHTPGTSLAYHAKGPLIEYNELIKPVDAYSANGKDISPLIVHYDSASFTFDEMTFDEQPGSARFTFDKKNLDDNPMLIVSGKQANWLEQTSEYFFRLLGDKYDHWVRRMDKVDPDKYREKTADLGMSMRVWLKTDQGWKKAGIFENAGTTQLKTMGLPLDLSEVSGDKVEIRLESAFKFWELDQVGISNHWREIKEFTPVEVHSATNEEGKDVSPMIKSRDGKYDTLQQAGSFINITFKNEASNNEVYIVRSTGFYHHIKDYQHPPDKKSLRQLARMGTQAAHQLSQHLDAYLRTMAIENVEATK